MPTYEYACTACQHEWEADQSIKDPPLETCEKCGEKSAKRLISRGGGFVLKGEGWTPAYHGSGDPVSSKHSAPPSSAPVSTVASGNTPTPYNN
jgi:putative FmdB family regulatory protein